MNEIFPQLSSYHWSLIAVLLTTIAVHYFAGIVLKRLELISSKTDNVWDDALSESAKRPLPVLIWLSGIFIALYMHYSEIGQESPVVVEHGRTILLTFCIAWFFLALIRNFARLIVETQIAKGQQVDITTVDGIGKVARILVWVLAGLVILQSMGFSISGVLAFGGIGGIAIGFAAKDLLANFLGGLILHLDRPFKLGESIRSPDKDIDGQVEYIGWRQTALRSRNMDMIYIPNSLFNSIVLVNLSRRSHRRIEEIIGLRYEDLSKLEAICSEARAMLLERADIDTSRDVVVSFNRYGESSLDLFVLAFTLTTNFTEFNAAKQAILLGIAEIVAKHGADFAFPTRTLHIEK